MITAVKIGSQDFKGFREDLRVKQGFILGQSIV